MEIAYLEIKFKGEPNVRIIKQAAVEDPDVRTPNSDEYIPGGGIANSGISLPVDYTMEGRLDMEIEVGKRVEMIRTKRNDVEMTGVFSSSPVTKIIPKDGGLEFHTLNSIYHLEWL